MTLILAYVFVDEFCREKGAAQYIAKLHGKGLLTDEEKAWWDDFLDKLKSTDWAATAGAHTLLGFSDSLAAALQTITFNL